MSIEITHRCVAKCVMCNIWKIPQDVPDLPMNKWISLFSSSFFSDLRELDITGGEPFLRKDLVEIVRGLRGLKGSYLSKLGSIAITTNGLLSKAVLEGTEQMVHILGPGKVDLVIVCALDAAGDLHDRIRNHENAWVKVNETIQGLKKLRERVRNLIIGLKTTILPMNVNHLEGIVEYADSNGLFTIISPYIVTDGRYLNKGVEQHLAFSNEDIQLMTEFFITKRSRWRFHGETLVDLFRKGMVRKPCSCGFNYFFIRSTGEVFLCPLNSRTAVGNISTTAIERLFHSTKANRIRREINRYPECRRCTEPGLERYALPYEGLSYLSILLRMGKEQFLELHTHLGLDKYCKG